MRSSLFDFVHQSLLRLARLLPRSPFGISGSEVSLLETADVEVCVSSSNLPKLQFRKDVSKACWIEELGMAEIVENKGGTWRTTGTVRSGKIYCSLEECLFLSEVGALYLLDENNECFQLEDIYKKVGQHKGGCCWESYEVYRLLKSLGYIVKRHGVPWSVKTVQRSVILQETSENKKVVDKENQFCSSLHEELKNMQINDTRPVFDVYLPNSKFKKSSPGDPIFVLCLTSGHPPSKGKVENLERRCNGWPLKFCHVEHGNINFISFSKAELPTLP